MILRRATRFALTALAVFSCLAAAFSCFAAADGTLGAETTQGRWPMTSALAARATTGGLCVQLGSEDLAIPLELARSGRFLVQVLDRDGARVARARAHIHAQGLYGLASVDQLVGGGRLPFAENLVNVLVVRPPFPSDAAALGEIFRVLCPGGLVLVAPAASETLLKEAGFEGVERCTLADRGETWRVGRKPWPTAMDEWTHPRHGADGNAVSKDTLVGPPRRVRWIAGPSREDARLVTAAGRNFYADVLARDAFNGLKLWEQPLKPGSPASPVAVGNLVFAVSQRKAVALDAATGATVREYGEAGTPADLMVADGALIAVDSQSVRAVGIDDGRLRWKRAAVNPRYVVAGDGAVYLLEGGAKPADKVAAVRLDLATGHVRWERADYPWAAKVRRLVYHKDLLVYEVSTLQDEKKGNAIHVASAADGRLLWSREFVPGMNHRKQARAMFIGDWLWILEHRQGVALDPKTGEVKRDCPAGLCHCFPPVATSRYLFSGEMELTDLATGRLDANRITKAACSPDYGWVPANGLIYACPKHCVCWPMLRGYVAMASDSGDGGFPKEPKPADFLLEHGAASPPAARTSDEEPWPCYRQNAWRSASTPRSVPADLKPLWTVRLGAWPEGTIADDWRENDFVRGPVTPPVIAAGMVFVARPDAHEVVALDAATGNVRWRFTANGRIDTPPTIHRGLCLFGTRSGWVYCLRAADGGLVWRLRAGLNDERIVAYGQIESPWPVPGSVLVVDDVAYFAAGRQALADGGILVFALDPASGAIRWVKPIRSLPMHDFYASIGLEFDNFDLLQREGDGVCMSRWLFDRTTGEATCKAKEAFLVAKMGGSGVIVPRGCWSYAPRHQPRHRQETPTRGLVVFRDNMLLGALDDGRTVYRRDFDLRGGEQLDPTWMTGWKAGENASKNSGEFWLSHRLHRKAKWSLSPFAPTEKKQRVIAMLLAREVLFAAGSEGGLIALSPEDGKVIARTPIPAPVWDGLAAADHRLFVATQAGEVLCLANSGGPARP